MLRIRSAVESDVASLLAIYAPLVRDTTITFETQVPEHEAFAARVLEYSRRFPWLVGEDEQGVSGYVYASPHRSRAAYRWSVGSSVFVSPRAQRTGVARRMMGVLLDALRRQGACRVYAGVTLPNDPSVALHRSLGFRSVGRYENVGFKHGGWHDVGWWQFDLAGTDEEPRPLGAPEDAVASALSDAE